MNISLKLSYTFLLFSSILLAAGKYFFKTPQIPNVLYIIPLFIFISVYSIYSIQNGRKFTILWYEFIYIFIVFLYFVLGIYNQNSLKNIIYDFVILTIPIVTYIVSKNYMREFAFLRAAEELNINLNTVILFCFPAILFFGSTMALFILIVLYFTFYSSNNFGLKGLFFSIIILGLIAVNGSKTYLVILAANYFLMQKFKGNTLRSIFILSICFTSLLMLNEYYYDEISSVSSTAFKFFSLINRLDVLLLIESLSGLDTNLLWSAVDTSTGQRLFELITVIEENLENSHVLLGEGLGGTSDLSNTMDMSIVVRRESGDVSNVRVFHLLITWLLKKTGLIGLVLFFCFLYKFFKYNKSLLTGDLKYVYYFIWVAFIFRISITFGSFLIHYYFYMIFAYFYTINESYKLKDSKLK